MVEIYPWRDGNHFELLIDGPVFFPRLLQAIDGAVSRVDLELYLVNSGVCASALLEALVAAAGRGVKVCCLLDGFGAQGLLPVDRQRLLLAGVSLRWYNPVSWLGGWRNLYRDHRKLLLVDGTLAYVGGAGVTDDFWNPVTGSCAWHEVMVEQRGPLVRDWQTLFDLQWLASAAPKAWTTLSAPSLQQLPAIPRGGDGWGRVAYASAREHRDILQSLLRSLKGARHRIWLATPYFLPTWKVRRALRKAASRGVEVRLLLTGQHTDNQPVRYAGQGYYPALLRAGVRIFEYQPRFTHLKMVLVDEWVSVGSCNFDYWNLRFNLDANLEARDAALTASVADSFRADFAQSHEVTFRQWKALPFSERFQRRLWGWLNRRVLGLLRQRF